jgi:hypothetical protein
LKAHAVRLPERFEPHQVSPAVVTQVNPVITVTANATSQTDGMASFIAGIVVGLALAFAMDQATDRGDGVRKQT